MLGAIHFLSTGFSDCIIIESNGHFAMVDAAEDTEYPPNKPECVLPGYEKEVCDYLLKNCADENGIVHLDFILGTHAHSDHIGGFDTVIRHPKIRVKRAFLKPYHEEKINKHERTEWDNLEVYNQMKNALHSKNIPVYDSFDRYSLMLGRLKITFYNGKYRKTLLKHGENIHSVVTLVEANGTRVLLSGDMNYLAGGEKRLSKLIGKVDLLKIGHHCYEGSSSPQWLKVLNPDISVITNDERHLDKKVKARIEKYTNSEIYTTVENGGVKAVFGGSGIKIETDIM